MSENVNQINTASLVRDVKSKKQIEALSTELVDKEMEEGFSDPLVEIVMATKLQAFFAARVSALRSYAVQELSGQKERGVLGSKVVESRDPSRWNYNDSYLSELEEEVKTVKDKAQKSSEKDRRHVTLSGEEVVISAGSRSGGGENVKVML